MSDFKPIRTTTHVVRWEATSPTLAEDPVQYLTVKDATDRLYRSGGYPNRAYIIRSLQSGRTLRTPFATYRID
jgi:hypothetical protein